MSSYAAKTPQQEAQHTPLAPSMGASGSTHAPFSNQAAMQGLGNAGPPSSSDTPFLTAAAAEPDSDHMKGGTEVGAEGDRAAASVGLDEDGVSAAVKGGNLIPEPWNEAPFTLSLAPPITGKVALSVGFELAAAVKEDGAEIGATIKGGLEGRVAVGQAGKAELVSATLGMSTSFGGKMLWKDGTLSAGLLQGTAGGSVTFSALHFELGGFAYTLAKATFDYPDIIVMSVHGWEKGKPPQGLSVEAGPGAKKLAALLDDSKEPVKEGIDGETDFVLDTTGSVQEAVDGAARRVDGYADGWLSGATESGSYGNSAGLEAGRAWVADHYPRHREGFDSAFDLARRLESATHAGGLWASYARDEVSTHLQARFKADLRKRYTSSEEQRVIDAALPTLRPAPSGPPQVAFPDSIGPGKDPAPTPGNAVEAWRGKAQHSMEAAQRYQQIFLRSRHVFEQKLADLPGAEADGWRGIAAAAERDLQAGVESMSKAGSPSLAGEPNLQEHWYLQAWQSFRTARVHFGSCADLADRRGTVEAARDADDALT